MTSNSSERYDRQIRLWGEGGQAALSRSSVLVLGSSATATETLKNLVLPGIGSFTIVDGSTCEETHAGNFFVQSSDASPSAFAAATNLSELNPAVRGSYIALPPESFLEDEPTATAFVSRYSLVIAAQLGLGHSIFRLISSACSSAGVPLLLTRSYGGLGLVRLQHPGGEATVLSSREDPSPDLRLRKPFPSLLAQTNAARAILQAGDGAGKVPFVLILSLALEAYRAAHGGALPTSREEKDEFRALVAASRPSGCPEESANFEEALKSKNLRLCHGPVPSLPSGLVTLFAHNRADPAAPRRINGEFPASPAPLPQSLPSPVPVGAPMDPGSRRGSDRVRAERDSFWLLVSAVRAFFEETGELPLSGKLPDMSAGTAEYVALQHAYTVKAAEDAARVLRFTVDIAEHRGTPGETTPDLASVTSFCKDVRYARLLPGRSLSDELDAPGSSGFMEAARDAGALEPSMSNSAIAYYPLFRTVDQFYKEHSRHPGSILSCLESDISIVSDILSRVKDELGGAGRALWRDEAEEMVRFANVELHNVAALVGGVAAQEAVKIITRQFVPLNNTLVFNFSNMTSASFSA